MINVNNVVENKGHLPEILSFITPFDVMNQKIGDLE